MSGSNINKGWGRVSYDGTLGFPLDNGGDSKPLVDEFGRVWVRPVGVDTPGFASPPIQASTVGFYVAAAVIHSGPTKLVWLQGFVDMPVPSSPDLGDPYFIQLHDINFIGASSATVIIPVRPRVSFVYEIPVEFLYGMTIYVSTTPQTYTAPDPPDVLHYTVIYKTP